MRMDSHNQGERYVTRVQTTLRDTLQTPKLPRKQLTLKAGSILVILGYSNLMELSKLLIERRISLNSLKVSM